MEEIKIFTREDYLISIFKYSWLRKRIDGLAEQQEEYHYGKVHKKHDKTFKMILEDEEVAADFINKVLKIKENKLKGEDIIRERTEYITSRFEKKEADILYRLKDRKVYFLIEHQSTIDYLMPYRVLEYQMEIMRSNTNLIKIRKKEEKIPKVIAIVIYTGKNKWNVEKDIKNMQEEFEGEGEVELGIYNFLDVNRYEKEELLEKRNLVYDMLLIEKSRNAEELERNLKEVVRKVDSNKELVERIIKITMLPTFGERKTKELIKKLYKDEGSDNMLQVTRMLNNELRLKHNEGRREGIKEGKREGIKEGIKEGKKEGKREGIRQGIIKVTKNLLKKKVDISEIKELTGLTEEEIKNIR